MNSSIGKASYILFLETPSFWRIHTLYDDLALYDSNVWFTRVALSFLAQFHSTILKSPGEHITGIAKLLRYPTFEMSQSEILIYLKTESALRRVPMHTFPSTLCPLRVMGHPFAIPMILIILSLLGWIDRYWRFGCSTIKV